MVISHMDVISLLVSPIIQNLRFSAEPYDYIVNNNKTNTSFSYVIPSFFLLPQDEALQLCIKISTAIDRVEFMFTTEFEAEVEESESATLHQYYREAMIQGYNFAFEVTVTQSVFLKTHLI